MQGLARHLTERRREYGLETLRVVEVGAGDGRLSFLLRRALANLGEERAVSVTATDDGSWRFAPAYPVEAVAASEAAANAHVAVAAWMPSGVDFTAAFRRNPKLREYVLIGEAYDGCCGHNWATWGNPEYKGPGDGADPPYAADGFAKVELGALSDAQIARYDCAAFSGTSRTFSFSRVRPG